MTDSLPLTPQAVARLTMDTEPWLSCDDCFDQVDVVIDGLLGSTATLSEEFRTHLLACPACHDEARTLAELAADAHQMSPAAARQLLETAVQRRG